MPREPGELDRGSTFVRCMVDQGFVVGWLRPGDRMLLRCACGAVTALTRDDLARLLGSDAPLEMSVLRLRCARCGLPPNEAWFAWQGEEDA
jgi:hypothetical protein